ncbi:thiosulfate oxidation carrier protein SoxY [Mesorhizobium sp. 1M-11]|uniref:thiosulfate oxidation carrier protein SoxY n=1 Tax=Mesorhizobium sp. 1M-11 TaxID=1529006 RepID=UPI0006C76BAD|nr:thiosulfate oxidation carrier protein SoxY [Mesorhizobium sp. 1M-11]
MTFTRRRMLVLAAGAAAIPILPLAPIPAFASAEEAAKLMADFAAGKEAVAGKLKLTAPEIAENGNTVPITVDVDSKMEGDDLVQSIVIFADGNPRPEVATFHFTALSGTAAATTRMRLAKTQNVIAMAKMSDGTVYMDKKEVKVTIGGCGG